MKKEFKNPFTEKKYQGRLRPEAEDARGVYYKDQAVIIHSLPFRRLKHKAQVFLDPNNDHVCTRIEHAFHVATIAASICRGLGLNEQIAYAIGLSHDLGHAPFGHPGEDVLNEKAEAIGGFVHEIHGLRIVDVLGNRGTSLNLSYIVRDGIICHCGEHLDKELEPRNKKFDLSKIKKKGQIPCSYEGCVARLSDKIAYLGRDLEDSIYGGFIRRSDIPNQIDNELGQTNGEIIDSLVLDVIETSKKKGKISFSEKKYKLIEKLSEFSIEKIYKHEALIRYQTFCARIIEQLFNYLLNIYIDWGKNFKKYFRSPVPLDRRFGRYLEQMKSIYETENWIPKRIITDYIAGMTDGYALRCMREISLPEELSFDQ